VHHESHRNALIAAGLAVLALGSGRAVCAGAAPPPMPPLEQLMALTGVLDRGPASSERLQAGLRAQNPSVPPEVWANYTARINDRSVLVHLYAPIYRRHLSGADTRAMLKFFRSPLGERYLAGLAGIENETEAGAQDWALSVANSLLNEDGGQSPGGQLIPPLEDPEPERTRAIRELIRLSGALAEAQSMSAQMIQGLRDSNWSDALIQRAQERLTSGTALSEFWVPAYARHFTPDDVRALNGFFGTPLGRRWVAAWPAIQHECLLAAASLGKDAAKRAIREVLGPLPQWRLLHPLPPPDGPEPGNAEH
jgi:uncharacterized protein